MKNQKIKIGLINFINCLPLSYCLEKEKPQNAELIYGTPARLNKLMAENKIDIAPISSFEYLKNKNKYFLMTNSCISSDGECGSVLLFSKKPINSLAGATIGLPTDSASSTAMLKIILNKYDIKLESIIFKQHNYAENIYSLFNSGLDAFLFIGDNALKNNCILDNSVLIYDIGTLWKELTGLPAVFGTWVAANEKIKQRDDFEKLQSLIPKAIETGLGLYFNEVLQKASENTGIKQEIIKDYLTRKIVYNYTEQRQKSLELFEKLYIQLNLA
ncbi:MAG TPA: menaquinone biosynthesis protein [Candidatus Gastranaerophilales bacterium]|nr:menaquinone biosynthesis protein [Candidatus Gastranaerophilales bacterium]